MWPAVLLEVDGVLLDRQTWGVCVQFPDAIVPKQEAPRVTGSLCNTGLGPGLGKTWGPKKRQEMLLGQPHPQLLKGTVWLTLLGY